MKIVALSFVRLTKPSYNAVPKSDFIVFYFFHTQVLKCIFCIFVGDPEKIMSVFKDCSTYN